MTERNAVMKGVVRSGSIVTTRQHLLQLYPCSVLITTALL
eukprot:COSAG06_NODE_957_length_11322_cov_9.239686_5_plen_40_part_00